MKNYIVECYYTFQFLQTECVEAGSEEEAIALVKEKLESERLPPLGEWAYNERKTRADSFEIERAYLEE